MIEKASFDDLKIGEKPMLLSDRDIIVRLRINPQIINELISTFGEAENIPTIFAQFDCPHENYRYFLEIDEVETEDIEMGVLMKEDLFDQGKMQARHEVYHLKDKALSANSFLESDVIKGEYAKKLIKYAKAISIIGATATAGVVGTLWLRRKYKHTNKDD